MSSIAATRYAAAARRGPAAAASFVRSKLPPVAAAAATTTTASSSSSSASASASPFAVAPRRPKSFSTAAPSRYEYPNRDELPIVTRTLASDAAAAAAVADDSPPPSSTAAALRDEARVPPNGGVDRFDDASALDPIDRNRILASQKSRLITAVDPKHRIGIAPPPSVPPNVPRGDLTVPETHLTSLPNGMRVASIETYGQVSTIGFLSDAGSRHESSNTEGVNHLNELLAFKSTEKYPDASDIVKIMDELGGSTFASSSREQMLYCVDVLRPSADEATEILAETILRPRITAEEVEDAKRAMGYQLEDMVPEVRLGEGLQRAAYGRLGIADGGCGDDERGGGGGGDGGGEMQQLGRPHFCTPEALPNLTPETVRRFRSGNLLDPTKIVVAGAGIEHSRLVDLAERHFGDLLPPNPRDGDAVVVVPTIPSTYTGGEYREKVSTIDGFVRVALAYEVGGWRSSDLVPACVLQTLLGGGNSFSAGGPGKGMYSRLYREVLNRYHWAESAEAFTSFHAESGLFGISGSAAPDKSRDLTKVLAEHFARLVDTDVTDEELDRARNMLKCNVLTQLESRLVLFEDVGRQILTYGKREGTHEMCEKIDGVTKEDIREIARRAVMIGGTDGGGVAPKQPTLSVVGDEVDKVPSQREVAGWFRH